MVGKQADHKATSTTMGRGIRAAAWVLASVLSANAETHTVQVGGGGLDKFSPDTLTARDGDVVIYSFHSGVSPALLPLVPRLTAARTTL